jgi:hypothetical protein
MYIPYQCIIYKPECTDSFPIRPMTSQSISHQQKLDAVGLVMQSTSREVVVESTGLSHSTIYRAIRNQRAHGDIEASYKKPDRKLKISQHYRRTHSFIFNNCLLCQELLHQVMEVPYAQLSEYVNEICNPYDVQISNS